MATVKVATVKDKFNMAIRCIPAYEHVTEKYAILDNGTLYFVGDKSWLKVENFIPCNGTIRISFKDLATIIDMPGGNPSVTITGDVLVGSGGRTSVRMKAITDVDVPTVDIPNEETFSDISDVFGYARDFYALIGPNTTVSTVNQQIGDETKGMVILHDAKYVAAAVGSPVIEGDITKLNTVIENAARSKAKIGMANNLFYIRIVSGDTIITAAIKLSAVSLSQHTKELVASIMNGTALDNPEVVITAKPDDLIGLSGSLGVDGNAKIANWLTSESGVQFTINETNGRTWNDNISAVCTAELEFRSRLITKEVVAASTASSTDKGSVKIKVDPFRKLLGVFPNNENPMSFMLIGVMLQR